jgi:hypothetical protein
MDGFGTLAEVVNGSAVYGAKDAMTKQLMDARFLTATI